MPTYDYECQHCGHGFELFQQMSAAVKRKCPECGKPKLKRLIGTGAGVLFKGSGFYETDYRSESYRKAAKAETETPAASSDSGGKDAKKADAKGASSNGTDKSGKPSKSKTAAKA
jgi:putative FmdB family regulatory protein